MLRELLSTKFKVAKEVSIIKKFIENPDEFIVIMEVEDGVIKIEARPKRRKEDE